MFSTEYLLPGLIRLSVGMEKKIKNQRQRCINTGKNVYWITVFQNYIHRQIEMNCLNRITEKHVSLI